LHAGEQIVKVLRVCTDSKNYPIVYHCSSGKDRTGLICALILGVCGVGREEIVENYCMSEECLKPVVDMIREEDMGKGLDEHFSLSPKEVMVEVLDYIESNYQSVGNYLKEIGFSELEQKKLRHLLLEGEQYKPTKEELELERKEREQAENRIWVSRLVKFIIVIFALLMLVYVLKNIFYN